MPEVGKTQERLYNPDPFTHGKHLTNFIAECFKWGRARHVQMAMCADEEGYFFLVSDKHVKDVQVPVPSRLTPHEVETAGQRLSKAMAQAVKEKMEQGNTKAVWGRAC